MHLSMPTTLHSVDATEQTEGFPNSFKLAFEDAAQAHHAWNQFIEDGTIPAHGRGPWVVFVGRKQGVFISQQVFNSIFSTYS